jgi:YjbE family integral membrane protein
MTVELLLKIAQIILIDIVLSGDNALVIAMAAHKLPPRQRTWAILGGGAIAILLRIVFTLVMAFLLILPGVRLMGGIVLIWIACKLLLGEEEEAEINSVRGGRSIWTAIRMIFVADFIMSLDNMLAVAGAAGEKPWMIVMGLLVSIAIIMTCSAGIAWLMNRYHWIVYAGAGILAFTAGEMIMGDREVAAYFAREQKITLSARWEKEFMLTRTEIAEFKGEALPEDLKDVVNYRVGEMEFIGQMNERQRDQLLERVRLPADLDAVKSLYAISSHRDVPEWVPAKLKPQVENWFQRRWPADVWKGVQGRQYNYVAWLFYAVVVIFSMTCPWWWRRRPPGDEKMHQPQEVNSSANSGASQP